MSSLTMGNLINRTNFYYFDIVNIVSHYSELRLKAVHILDVFCGQNRNKKSIFKADNASVLL